jgi:hypothetical protein
MIKSNPQRIVARGGRARGDAGAPHQSGAARVSSRAAQLAAARRAGIHRRHALLGARSINTSPRFLLFRMRCFVSCCFFEIRCCETEKRRSTLTNLICKLNHKVCFIVIDSNSYFVICICILDYRDILFWRICNFRFVEVCLSQYESVYDLLINIIMLYSCVFLIFRLFGDFDKGFCLFCLVRELDSFRIDQKKTESKDLLINI